MEILEIKNTITEIKKNSVDGLNSRIDYTERESVNLKIEQ